MVDQRGKAEAFEALHRGAPFLIPNPWDVGSARVLQALGFEALATTSSGFAFTLGRRDGKATLDDVVAHVGAVTGSTDLPVSVDLENGYGTDLESVSVAISRVAEAGAVGASIEDYDPSDGIYPIEVAARRVAAAVATARELAFPFLVTARAENHIRGNPNLDDTIARLKTFEEAGADVLYAPGLAQPSEIASVCKVVSKPVNVLALGNLSFQEVAAAGAQRVSVGGALTWVAVDAFTKVAQQIAESGDLSGLRTGSPPSAWLVG
jgi:2-methylisocitrate lyase-like PEP mutase family enzyme